MVAEMDFPIIPNPFTTKSTSPILTITIIFTFVTNGIKLTKSAKTTTQTAPSIRFRFLNPRIFVLVITFLGMNRTCCVSSIVRTLLCCQIVYYTKILQKDTIFFKIFCKDGYLTVQWTVEDILDVGRVKEEKFDFSNFMVL